MKVPASAFFLLFLVNAAYAQTFFPLPGPVLEKEVEFEQANECFIFFQNPSGDTLQLRWRILSESIPPDWTIDLCDYGLCYIGIPPNGTMNPVYDSIQPYLKLIVQPGTTPGAAWLWFRVFEKDNQENFTDAYFSLHTPGTTGVSVPQKTSLKVFPNPASDWLFVENNDEKKSTARLLSAEGQQVWSGVLLPRFQSTIDLRVFPAGIYFLQTDDQQLQKILIQK